MPIVPCHRQVVSGEGIKDYRRPVLLTRHFFPKIFPDTLIGVLAATHEGAVLVTEAGK
jgi:hypothetical protein